ncbi:hypothetical protein EVAR_62043_1 [Eumeta japonica]|uniref:Uncharacterized protein n=1 Tax=Eumeta variegata TaxID=151549 RepID=A0A4C1YNI6_EUMVA|nr:hypothetical protein EVAR_62043_1 [Eumeta japonica]
MGTQVRLHLQGGQIKLLAPLQIELLFPESTCLQYVRHSVRIVSHPLPHLEITVRLPGDEIIEPAELSIPEASSAPQSEPATILVDDYLRVEHSALLRRR